MASIEVKLLDQVSGGIVATLAERSLDFRVPLRLPEPIGKLEFAAKLGELDLSLETELDLTLSVEIDAGSVQFELVKDVEMTVAVRVEAGRTDASATARVSGKVGPLRLPSFTLTLDPRDLERLPSLILDRVTREVERLFADAERWLQAVLDGTIRSITSVAVVLREHFRKTEREAAKLLKKAGYTVERAAEALDVALDQMLNVLVGPDAFTEQELVDAFGRMVGHTNPAWLAREVGDLLLHNGMDPDRVVEHVGRVLSEPKKVAEVLSFLDYPADEIADFLRRNGVGIRETGLLVAGFFPFFRTEEELSDALRFGGYVAAEAASVATNIVRESWRGVENVRDEVERAWRRYMPRFKW